MINNNIMIRFYSNYCECKAPIIMNYKGVVKNIKAEEVEILGITKKKYSTIIEKELKDLNFNFKKMENHYLVILNHDKKIRNTNFMVSTINYLEY